MKRRPVPKAVPAAIALAALLGVSGCTSEHDPPAAQSRPASSGAFVEAPTNVEGAHVYVDSFEGVGIKIDPAAPLPRAALDDIKSIYAMSLRADEAEPEVVLAGCLTRLATAKKWGVFLVPGVGGHGVKAMSIGPAFKDAAPATLQFADVATAQTAVNAAARTQPDASAYDVVDLTSL